jgi:hypothetical protein
MLLLSDDEILLVLSHITSFRDLVCTSGTCSRLRRLVRQHHSHIFTFSSFGSAPSNMPFAAHEAIATNKTISWREIRKISFAGCTWLSDTGLTVVLANCALANIDEINLSGCDGLSPATLKSIGKLRNLTALDISGSVIFGTEITQ